LKAARRLFGQYRRPEAADPDQFTHDVASIFSGYPSDTVEYVLNGNTGLAANPIPDPKTGQVWKGLPDLADVKKACENHFGPIRRRMQREQQQREQLEERERLVLSDQRTKKTYAELQADCHARGLFIGDGKAAAPAFDVDGFCIEHGITKEQWDAIPNAGDYDNWLRSQGLKR
jgi:hypothetical protein